MVKSNTGDCCRGCDESSIRLFSVDMPAATWFVHVWSDCTCVAVAMSLSLVKMLVRKPKHKLVLKYYFKTNTAACVFET